MIQTVEAIIDEHGAVRLLSPLQLATERRDIVTILDEAPVPRDEAALLSKSALGEDWNRAEEEAAWSYLQPGK